MIRRFFPLVALAVAVIVPAAASAAVSAAPMSLSDAVSYALDHNATVAQQYAAVQQAQHTLALQRSNAFPTVNGSLQNVAQKSSNLGGTFEIIGLQQQAVFSQNTAQIGTNYLLDTGGLAFLQLASARAQEAQAEQTLANTEDQVATNVTNAFYTVVQRQAIVVVDLADLQYQNVLVDAAKAKEQNGVAAGVDVLKAEVAQAKSESTLIGARADVDDARETLAQSIDASLDQAFAFPSEIAQPKLPTQSVQTLEDLALNARPDVKAASDGVAAAKFTRTGWGRELFPQVQIGAAFGNQFAPTSAGTEIGITSTGQPILQPRGSPGFWSLSATSTFTLPFEDYGARHTERVNDDAQIASAERALDQARTQVQLDVRQSYRAAQTALAQLSYAGDESRLGTESARIAELQYQHGLISLSDVIQTQQQSRTAQYDLVSARVSYIDAVVKLRVSLGTYTAQSAVADL
jgi:outer membrane protein TolC